MPDAIEIDADIRQTADGERRAVRTGAATLDVDVRDVVADVFEAVKTLQL